VWVEVANQEGPRESELKPFSSAGRQWLTPAILATQEAEIRRIDIRSQPKQIVQETISKTPNTHIK
jgi:hypothetical protein